MKIRIITPSTGEVEAELTVENLTAFAIWEALPFEGRANTWGDEIYFSIPVVVGSENPKEVVNMGDIAYWPPGKAFCIFFGSTPASRGGEIRPASPVNVIGRILDEPHVFRKVGPEEPITLRKV